MYHGSLQQLQMIQQAEFAQAESQQQSLSSPPSEQSLPQPLILTVATRWEKLWSSLAQRRRQPSTAPGRASAV